MAVVAVSMMHMIANHVVGQALKRCQHVDDRNSNVRVDDPGPEVLECWDEPVHVNQSYTLFTHAAISGGMDWIEPDRTRFKWTRLDWTGLDCTGSDHRTGLNQIWTRRNWTRPDQTGPDWTEPCARSLDL